MVELIILKCVIFKHISVIFIWGISSRIAFDLLRIRVHLNIDKSTLVQVCLVPTGHFKQIEHSKDKSN